VCVCVCAHAQEGGGGGGPPPGPGGGGPPPSDRGTSSTDQLADLCSDSFPALLVVKSAVVEWTGNERAS
jgi:hypothetical protein